MVNQLGYFERVDVSEEEGTARDQMVINVEVAEKPTGTFQVGAGFSSLESFIITAQVQQQNLFGRGQTLGLNLQVSGIRQQIDLNFVEPLVPRVRMEPWLRSVQAHPRLPRLPTGLDRREHHDRTSPLQSALPHLPPVRVRERQHLAAPRKPPRRRWRPSEHLLQHLHRQRVPRRNHELAPVHAQLGQPRQPDFDDAVASSRTTRCRLPISTSVRTTRSFGKPRSDASTRRCSARWSSRSTPRSGLITSRKSVPVFERFYLGGIYTIRGYRLQSVGPQAGVASAGDPNLPIIAQGRPIGGDFQAFYNIEFEFPLIEAVGIKGVIFTDGGNAWNIFAFQDPFGNCQAPVAPAADRSSAAMRHSPLPPVFGRLWDSMVLSSRPAPFRVGHSDPPTAPRQPDPLRVHHRPVVLSE